MYKLNKQAQGLFFNKSILQKLSIYIFITDILYVHSYSIKVVLVNLFKNVYF